MATFFWKIKVFLSKNDREGLARNLISSLNHANLIVYVDGAQSAQKSATSMKRVVAQERMLVKLEKRGAENKIIKVVLQNNDKVANLALLYFKR
jgi:hypothetical protein